MAGEEMTAKKEIQKDKKVMQAQYHRLMEGELELRKIELQPKIEQRKEDRLSRL